MKRLNVITGMLNSVAIVSLLCALTACFNSRQSTECYEDEYDPEEYEWDDSYFEPTVTIGHTYPSKFDFAVTDLDGTMTFITDFEWKMMDEDIKARLEKTGIVITDPDCEPFVLSVGLSEPMDWNTAMIVYTDSLLPTAEQGRILAGNADALNIYINAFDGIVPDKNKNSFWTSTEPENFKGLAYCFNMQNGMVNKIQTHMKQYVRTVKPLKSLTAQHPVDLISKEDQDAGINIPKAKNLDLVVMRNGRRMYFDRNNWRDNILPTDEIYGIAIISGDQRFILSCKHPNKEPIDWKTANIKYDNLPDEMQAQAICDNGMELKEALSDYGIHTLILDLKFWTSTPAGNNSAVAFSLFGKLKKERMIMGAYLMQVYPL